MSEIERIKADIAETEMFRDFWLEQEIGEEGEPIDKEEYKKNMNKWIAEQTEKLKKLTEECKPN